MVWIPVEKVPESRTGKNRPKKYDSTAERLREQPGQKFIIAHELTKGKASEMVQALKSYEGIDATSRTHDLPEGVGSIAVFAWFENLD